MALQRLLDLMRMRGFVVNGLVEALAILELLSLITRLHVDQMSLLIGRGYQVHFVEVDWVLSEEAHLHLTSLTKAVRIDMS